MIDWNRIDIAIYDDSLYVGFVNSHNKLYKVAKKDGARFNEADKYADMDGLFYYNKDSRKRIIFVLPTSNRLIVHETLHAAMHILDDIGQKFDMDNHEVYAWLQDYLFEEICGMREMYTS